MQEVHTRYGRGIYVVFGGVVMLVGVVCMVGRLRSMGDLLMSLVALVIGAVLLLRSRRLGLSYDDHWFVVWGLFATQRFERHRCRLVYHPERMGAGQPRIRHERGVVRIEGLTVSPARASKQQLSVLLSERGLLQAADPTPDAGTRPRWDMVSLVRGMLVFTAALVLVTIGFAVLRHVSMGHAADRLIGIYVVGVLVMVWQVVEEYRER